MQRQEADGNLALGQRAPEYTGTWIPGYLREAV
jgi:hypothetical protein